MSESRKEKTTKGVKWIMEKKIRFTTKKMTTMALLVALAYVSLMMIRVPIIPTASFLRYDIKDIFITIGGLLLGPGYAIAGAICVSLLQMLTVSEYGVIGLVMNILSVSSFSGVASVIYNKKKNKKGLIIGLIAGAVIMTVTMLLWNYCITPFYMGVSREAVASMLLPVFLPFNVLKSGINAICTFVIYEALLKVISKNEFGRKVG